MARPLVSSPMHNLLFSSMPITTLVFALLAVFSIFSIITFLCGSKNMKKLHTETEEAKGSKENKLISKLNSNISSRAHSMVKMLSWRKVEAEGEEEEEEEGDYNDQDEEALWRKTILMGERCRPIEFSVNIVHDSEGKNAS